VETSEPIKVLDEERTIRPSAGGFTDRSQRLSVHIYEI
jgi:hypothetical protein